ncbi:unnamed protein product, partial [Mesorhabditis spiculigera]
MLPVKASLLFLLPIFALNASAKKCYSCRWATTHKDNPWKNQTGVVTGPMEYIASCQKPTSDTPTCESNGACMSVTSSIEMGGDTLRGCLTPEASRPPTPGNDGTVEDQCVKVMGLAEMCVCTKDRCNGK